MNETQQMLEDSVNRLFGDRLDWDALTRIEELGFPAELWHEVTDQGIHKVLADEDRGGMGVGWSDAYPVLRACGRHAVPLPVVETAIVEWLARQADCALPEGVPGLLPGTLDAAVLSGDGLSLRETRVPWGGVASYLAGVTAVGGGAELVIAAGEGLDVAPELNIGRDPRDRLSGTARIVARH
ncbi:MAG: acyl-CoA dehydrogenase family protein, partial [Gammaproteobacteria bacterium]